jgi:hypothetical protein
MIRMSNWVRLLPGAAAVLIFVVAVVTAIAPPCAQAAGGDEDDNSRLVVMADFNHDGIADLAEALPGDGAEGGILKVSLGEANGGYRVILSRPVLGKMPRAIVTGDFDGDGNPDVIVGDDDGTLKVFLGDGTGNLASGGDIARLDSVVSIAVADFNHDGIADIAVSDWRAGSVTILMAAGKGSFQRGWSFKLRMPAMVAKVSAADFNGDGIPDLAVIYGDEDGYTFDVMLGDGSGSFVFSPKLSFVRDPNSHCPA